MARSCMIVGYDQPHSVARSVSHFGSEGKCCANVSLERVASPNV